ncbi:hypothetical protein EDB85DRAFT_2211049, partial [Lactarius pseudohatsudake]
DRVRVSEKQYKTKQKIKENLSRCTGPKPSSSSAAHSWPSWLWASCRRCWCRRRRRLSSPSSLLPSSSSLQLSSVAVGTCMPRWSYVSQRLGVGAGRAFARRGGDAIPRTPRISTQLFEGVKLPHTTCVRRTREKVKETGRQMSAFKFKSTSQANHCLVNPRHILFDS